MSKAWKRPQLSLNIQSNIEETPSKEVKKEDIKEPLPQPKMNLQLEGSSSIDVATMSCVINSKGIKVAKEDFEIDTLGMKNLSSGQFIVGNLQKEDLEIQQVIGNGACGYVYKAIHKPTGKSLALKSINAFDKPKRH